MRQIYQNLRRLHNLKFAVIKRQTMGNVFGQRKFESELLRPNSASEGRKRKREDNVETSQNTILEILNTPKRKRMKSTSKYIYQTLFLESENSDVTIRALNKDWKLHKLYLKQLLHAVMEFSLQSSGDKPHFFSYNIKEGASLQYMVHSVVFLSPYFACMFSGSWKESDMNTITIDIIDDNISEESLKIAFGSLYKDDVFMKPVQAVSVLATATMLQLDGLIHQCSAMMTDTLSSSTVCAYYHASVMYGLEEMRIKCFEWLTRNLLLTQNLSFIKDIPIDLMKQIVSSHTLYVMQVEIDIYSLLRKWIFLISNCSWAGGLNDLGTDTDNYFKDKIQGSDLCFLETVDGKTFMPVFMEIRWHNVINDLTAIKMIENDRVLPIAWLEPMFLYGWRRVLTVEQGIDKGPVDKVDESVFNQSCIRCGRVLQKQADYCWRYVGYNYGIDLLISLGNRLVSLKRNTHTDACPQAVSLQAQRHLCYRMTISSLDIDSKDKLTQCTGIKNISLGKDEEEIAMVLDKNLEFPLAISMNLMLISPMTELPIPKLKIPNG